MSNHGFHSISYEEIEETDNSYVIHERIEKLSEPDSTSQDTIMHDKPRACVNSAN